MKKIATVTFHAAYNYGSCLQAFALQEFIKKMCSNNCIYNILNLRTDKQLNFYNIFNKQKNLKLYIKRFVYFPYRKAILSKYQKFESFINDKLCLSDLEFKNIDDLKQTDLNYDYYIAGSDQLWNINSFDFDWSNFLEFTEEGKKISYAASFGPKVQVWNDLDRERVKENLKKFSCLSVREQGSFNNVKELIGVESEINVDPTMLLKKEEWEEIIPKERLYKNKYIFLYNLKSKDYVKLAHKISMELGLPILVSTDGKLEEFFYGFKRKIDVGPLEFLNLIKHSELTLSSSFHGTIFSILLNKPFFALKGKDDFRIKTLLEKMDLNDRSIDFDDYKEKCKNAYNVDFSSTYKLLDEEREKSKRYLMNALDIK